MKNCVLFDDVRWSLECLPVFVYFAHGIDLTVTMNMFDGMLVQLELPNA